MKKVIALFLCVALMISLFSVPVWGADSKTNDEITVLFNGEKMEFDVPPVIINDRTMVPMRAIFEKLGCDVSWNDENETATGSRNGIRVLVTIGSNVATKGHEAIAIDQPAVVINDRTMVPLRFISEAYDCLVDWDENTKTVSITSKPVKSAFNLTATSFTELGTWNLSGTFLQGTATGASIDQANGEGSKDAVATINVTKPGKYKLWARDRDYATNQPGTRTFNVAVDGVQAPKLLGAHKQEGFRWTEVGTYDLTAGEHKLALQDTSGFFARCEGLFLTEDLDIVPPDKAEELSKICGPTDVFSSLPSANFPSWANQDMNAVKTDSIENDKVKVVFYQGESTKGPLVQNEIYVKEGDNWTLVKKRSEELGFLMLSAKSSSMAGKGTGGITGPVDDLSVKAVQTVNLEGNDLTTTVDSYYRSGIPTWFIPTDFEKTSDKKIVLTFPNKGADLKVAFEMDALTVDPKVTLDAKFNKKGAYSFVLSSGSEIKSDEYKNVTAPFLFVKNVVPAFDRWFAECYMFTPMATFTLPNKVPGKELTTGVVFDPTGIPQDFAYPKTSRFGLLLRTPTNNLRGQFVAPMFGTEASNFEEGADYSVSYRIVNSFDSWFDTYKHVSEDIYKLADIRTNYFSSINDAIYNSTDLMMDDMYGGWDSKDMGFDNMEAKGVSTQSNVMEAVQRYLLTDNDEILEKRAIPTIAYLMSRGGMHFKNDTGDNSYTPKTPTAIGNPVPGYNTSVYGGLYEMSQGRMPFLLNNAVSNIANSGDLSGVTSQTAMYNFTGDKAYLDKVKELADKFLDNTLNSSTYKTTPFNNAFVFGDYAPLVTTFLAAYEATGDQKYLDAAKEAGKLLVTAIWTTGYQNDYATNEYTVDPVQTSKRFLNCDDGTPSWWWHGDTQWRLGNEFGVAKKPQEGSNTPLVEETVPGWLPAKTGLGTEHPGTASHGNYIYMNTWAGMLEKLSYYTGDPYFEMQARNAIVGRFGNYAGYYQDRYIVHQMRADYPYVGPDYTLIYWHHIPNFIAMLEDYLVNSVWAKSDRNIEFPSVYQSGYAYFVSNQYGFKPGKFYDEDNMWLWLDRGIVQPDSVEIDYITARKDGTLGVSLVNEGNEEKTTTVTLGEKVPGGAGYNGTATLYDASGAKSQINVTDGKFTVTIPSKGIQSVVLKLDGVKKPSYINENFAYSTDLGDTVATHTRGKAYALQLSPKNYFAYVYVTDQAAGAKKMTLTYQIGDGKKQTKEINEYPFETIIKVEDPSKDFKYTVAVTKADGTTEDLGGNMLKPMTNGATTTNLKGVSVPQTSTLKPFEPFSPNVIAIGSSGETQIRFVVPVDKFPFAVSENIMIGAKVKVVLTNKTDGSILVLDSVIDGNEMRTGQTVLKVKPTAAVPAKDYSQTHNAVLMIFSPDANTSSVKLPGEDGVKDTSSTNTTTTPTTPPENPPVTQPAGNFTPITMTPVAIGVADNLIRFVIPTDKLPFSVTENGMKDMRIKATITKTADGSKLILDSIIVGNEMRTGQTVLKVKPTDAVPYAHYGDGSFKVELTISPAN